MSNLNERTKISLILLKKIILENRGVSDVGFLIFADADTDADFAF